MLVGKGNVGPTLAPFNGGLIYRKLWLQFWSDYVSHNSSKQAAKAGGELERSKIVGGLRPWLLRDPDKQID